MLSTSGTASATQSTPATSRVRWIICTLLLFSTTINYMDRQVISYLKVFFCMPIDHGGFGWTNSDFSNVTSAFTAFYAGMTVLAGWLIDKIGTKLGLAMSLIVWSIFGILNAFVGSTVVAHAAIRSAFGIGEAGNFPASIKTVAEWFPKRERALATGIFNSGSNIGAMISSLFVPWCLATFGFIHGWKIAYISTGAIGFFWLIAWFLFYEVPARHKRLSSSEFDYIHADDDPTQERHAVQEAQEIEKSVQAQGAAELPLDARLIGDNPIEYEQRIFSGDAGKVRWLQLFEYPQTWSFFMAKFMTDGIWWFYLFWLPDYLGKQFGLDQHAVRLPTFTVYGVAIIGSVYGGSLPMFLNKRGMEIYKARLTAMLIISIFPLSVLFTQYFGNVDHFHRHALYLAVATICIAAAAHQAWSANLFTTVSDMFPKKAVSSVTGIGAMAGGIGGVVVQKISGYLTDLFKANPQHAYLIMFIICALSYITAWGIMVTLVPRHRPITDL